MFIVYIAFGFVSGIIAAAAMLMSGSGFFAAFVAYVLAGVVGMGASLWWSFAPRQDIENKTTVTQQS
ncbi:hypothetical protein MWU60_00145 [Yoonia sp. F2084L]|uniref:hypothetical protein n=1 Tax=Yoonia sp. F2084L TaxID=2926419 RepID=UPI001FF59359|nr:hypothetical protein [Yoonia sp. F2084L]MCK0093962.1 hypothetical protein [Yoonia sp. F2084L]